jgi:hypothetical protein
MHIRKKKKNDNVFFKKGLYGEKKIIIKFFKCHKIKSKSFKVRHILLYKTHMQVGNSNKMDSNK